MRGFHTYNAFSERDSDPIRKRILRNMAEAEARHAALWGKANSRARRRRCRSIDGKATGDADTLANRVGGPGMALRRLEIDESRDIARMENNWKSSATSRASRFCTRSFRTSRSTIANSAI